MFHLKAKLRGISITRTTAKHNVPDSADWYMLYADLLDRGPEERQTGHGNTLDTKCASVNANSNIVKIQYVASVSVPVCQEVISPL